MFETCLIFKTASWLLKNTIPEKFIDAESFQEEFSERIVSLQLKVNPKILIDEISSIPGHLQQVLWSFNPHSVLLMEPDLRTIRTLEMTTFQKYCLTLTEKPRFKISDFLVQILVYRNSVEHQQYLSNIQAEEAAWKQIIQQRQYLVVPLNETYVIDDETFLDLVAEAKYKESSRKAGGQTARHHRMLSERDSVSTIIVDTREFRSSLPFQIHCRQIKIVPLTLIVGDYVLSREVCIERKAVPDFIGSLNSGRLFDQASELVRHYADPGLLIEFSGEGGFAYKSREWIFAEAQRNDSLNRLCLLILTFPKLRLLWSPASYFTANLFILLKEDREQPDSFRAALIGSDKTDEKAVKMQYATYRLDFLQKIPGITNKSVNILIRRTPFLAAIATLKYDNLRELIGETNAKEVQKFLDTEWSEVF